MKKFIFIILLFSGCAASKDNKALSRILVNPTLSDRAYSELVKEHPIKIDTAYKLINGETVVTYDTTQVPVYYTDTVINTLPQKTKIITQLVTKNIYKVDTLIKTVQDFRQLDASKTRVTVLETQLTAAQNSNATLSSGKLHWIFISIGIGVLLLLGIFLVIKKVI